MLGIVLKAFLKLDGLWCPSVNADAFATLRAYYDLDLWPPESNQAISGG